MGWQFVLSQSAERECPLQATRSGLYPNQLNPMLAAGTQPGLPNSTLSAAALINRALSPQPQIAQPMASLPNIKPGTVRGHVSLVTTPKA